MTGYDRKPAQAFLPEPGVRYPLEQSIGSFLNHCEDVSRLITGTIRS